MEDAVRSIESRTEMVREKPLGPGAHDYWYSNRLIGGRDSGRAWCVVALDRRTSVDDWPRIFLSSQCSPVLCVLEGGAYDGHESFRHWTSA